MGLAYGIRSYFHSRIAFSRKPVRAVIRLSVSGRNPAAICNSTAPCGDGFKDAFVYILEQYEFEFSVVTGVPGNECTAGARNHLTLIWSLRLFALVCAVIKVTLTLGNSAQSIEH